MTSVEEFNCILCKETFDNKDELQVHFRKHGDPKFNESIKTKSRVQNETPFANEKSNDASEMVNCDVCNEVFPTISKAITHKHKVHPEHDAKYFCPWCGKLFTMKHLYNKHLLTNHDASNEAPGSSDSHFHCDCCSVYFVVPSAMVYHNKFFHRQDTELPIIGHSKKQKLVNQDLLPVYYCSFCGEEYINKINLHKHMCDDHEDENQRPTDVLRCPLCEAVFYHLDAYELHLTFHSSEDLYTETNEMNEKEMTEFSLETVPPVMERIEDLNNLPNVETDANAVGIESFLQMAMDEPKESNHYPEKKSKKHKKHKKSKKAAITLDEFLSMNQDVFGEDLDFQGIEEVPTKVIAKQLKVKKPSIPKSVAKHVSSVDLQKLQKLGIAVKVPSGHKPPFTKVKSIGQPIRSNPQVKKLVNQTKTNVISASNDVLSKLFNQSSSQLKIVKMSAQDKVADGDLAATEKSLDLPPADTTEAYNQNAEIGDCQRSCVAEVDIPRRSPTYNQEINPEEPLNGEVNESAKSTNADSKENHDACTRQNNLPNVSNNISAGNNVNDTIKNIGKQITIKPITQSAPCFEEKSLNTGSSEITEPEVATCQSDDLNSNQNDVPQKTSTLDSLKNLNSAITIKSLKNMSAPETNKNSTSGNDKTDVKYKTNVTDNATITSLQKQTTSENVKQDLPVHMTSPSQVLQNISKSITIKSTSPQIKHQKEVIPSDEHYDSDFAISEDNSLTEHLSNNNGDNVNKQSVSITSSTHVLKNKSKTIAIKPMTPLLKYPKEDIPKDELNNYENNTSVGNINKGDKNEETSGQMASTSQVLKNVSKNITIKSLSHLTRRTKDVLSPCNDIQNDSDFDIPEEDKVKEQQVSVLSTSHVLKNISKNITIKTMAPLVKNPKNVPSDDHDDSDIDNHDNDARTEIKSEKLNDQAVPKISSNQVLKNISKNVTIKPMSPLAKQTKEDDLLDGNDTEFDNFDDELPIQNDGSSGLHRLKNVNAGHQSNVKIKSSPPPYAGTCVKNNEHKMTNIQSSNNLLKNLKNITAKPVLTNKNVSQQPMVKPNKEPSAKNQEIKKSVHTKEISQDIEIYNIDDSDDEYEQQTTNKIEQTHTNEPIKANVSSPAVLNAIKNMSKHITVKPPNNQTTLQVVKKEQSFSEQFSDEDEMHDVGEYGCNDDFEEMLDTSHKQSFVKKDTKNKNDFYNNVLKQLGQQVTVKSKNAFDRPNTTINHTSQNVNHGDDIEHDTDSDEDSFSGKVKITEVNEDDEDVGHTNNCNTEGIVTQSPEDSNSGDEQITKGIEDMDECISQNLKVRLNENLNPSSQGLLKNISKNITIRSLIQKTADTSENGSRAGQSSVCKELLTQHVKQNNPNIKSDNEKIRISNMSHNKRNEAPSASGPSSPNVQQKFTKPSAVNTVNKEVKVKSFQSETVIEEITTTVTKTIRRVNQTTVNQQVFNASKVSSSPRMVKPQMGPRMTNIYSSNNLKGLTVRQPNPRAVRPQMRHPVSVRPPSGTVVRPSVSNQLVAIRPGATPIRPMNVPRMPVKSMPRQPRPAGTPLKISPNVVNQTLKRPGNEETPGHFSCFKKPKESLIPGNETAESSTNFQYASSSQTSKFYSASQTMKGNSVVTATQMKTQSVTQQQQISRLGNISGLKVSKTCQVTQVEKTEQSPSKRSALEAIEKLQKQGLLIKKPRVEEDPNPSTSDDEEHEQFDDYDE